MVRRRIPYRAALAAIALLLVAACASDDGSASDARADQVRDAALEAGLSDDVADVLATAARGVDGTYSVTYEVDDTTVTVTQRPPDRRVETASADGTVDVVLTVDGSTSACTDPPGDEQVRCDDLGSAPPPGPFDADAVAELTDALAASSVTVTLVVEEREIAGEPADCVVTDPPSATLCVADTGAILLVERPAGTLRASAYTTDVPDDAFELPT